MSKDRMRELVDRLQNGGWYLFALADGNGPMQVFQSKIDSRIYWWNHQPKRGDPNTKYVFAHEGAPRVFGCLTALAAYVIEHEGEAE